MGRRKNLKKYPEHWWESAEQNTLIYDDFITRLTDIAINVYQWHNLPDTIDERFLELALFNNGAAVFFYDDEAGFLALQTMYGGNLDVYRIPGDRRAYAVNGYQRQLNARDSVLIFNNFLRTPSFTTIEIFARKLYQIERTLNVNINAQKTPVMVLSNEKQRLTMKNLMLQYEGNEPFIFGDENLDVSKITALNTQAPYIADKLDALKKSVWNEALTFLGVENSNTEKKERLITDEVTTNLGNVEVQRYTKLNARRQAAEKINRMFNLNIEVDFRSNTTTIDTGEYGNEYETEPQAEGVTNE